MTDSNNTITIPNDPPPDNNGQGAQATNAGNTGTGFLVGTTPSVASQTYQTPPNQTLTPEQIAALGAQAVAPQLQQIGASQQTMEERMAAMQAEIDIARQEREASAQAAADAEAARIAAEQQVAEQEMSATELVNKVRDEFQQRFDQQEATIAASNAILEQERHFQALQEYKASRLADPEIAQAVMPHLHQYIGGNSEQEIEEAIARAAATSNSIVGEFQAYQQQYRQQAPGISAASPTAGPLESQTQQRQMSAQEIAALPPAEYARLRPQLLKAASDAHRAAQGR